MSLEWKTKRMQWKVQMYLHTHLGFPIEKKKYYGRPILDIRQTGEWLKEALVSGRVFTAARLGGTELRAMVALQPEFKDAKQKEERFALLRTLSGFFGSTEDYERFGREMEGWLKEIDLCGVWFNQMEDYILEHHGRKDMVYGKLEGLEPWYVPEDPWTAALKGKRVVVIHPFAESIVKQYGKREQLFAGSDILPEFDLRVVKAVQTLMGEETEYGSWFAALDHMLEEALKEDFDVALIACGAYGLPLAAKLKQAGKSAVHVGGSLQLLFGVMGGRWKEMKELKPFYNDAWASPLKSEGLKAGNEQVEKACYW